MNVLNPIEIFVETVLISLVILILHALLKSEAVARAYELSERIVEGQLRRVPRVDRPLLRPLWMARVRDCRDRNLPITAVFTAVFAIPRLCRRYLRAWSMAKKERTGVWVPWTRTGKMVHRAALWLIDETLKESLRAALIDHTGRINWHALPSRFESFVGEIDCQELFEDDPSVLRASLLSEADTLRNLLNHLGPNAKDRPMLTRAYQEVMALLRETGWRGTLPIDSLIRAKAAMLEARQIVRAQSRTLTETAASGAL